MPSAGRSCACDFVSNRGSAILPTSLLFHITSPETSQNLPSKKSQILPLPSLPAWNLTRSPSNFPQSVHNHAPWRNPPDRQTHRVTPTNIILLGKIGFESQIASRLCSLPHSLLNPFFQAASSSTQDLATQAIFPRSVHNPAQRQNPPTRRIHHLTPTNNTHLHEIGFESQIPVPAFRAQSCTTAAQ